MSESKKIRDADAIRSGRDGGESDANSSGSSRPLVGGDTSYQATAWVLQFSESQLGARLVLLTIAHHLNYNSQACFPSLETIAKECRMTKAGVIQAIDRLEGIGELVVEREGNPGRGSSNTYFMPEFSDWWEKAKALGKKGKKGIDEESRRVNPITERVNAISEKGIPGIPEEEVNKNLEEEVEEVLEKEEVTPSLNDSKEKDWKKIREDYDRAQAAQDAHRAKKQARAEGRTIPRAKPANVSKIVTNKQPESWLWFAGQFKRMTDVNAFSHQDLWPLVEEMLSEIGKSETLERLSLFIDGADKISGYLAKDFLIGGWRTIDPEDERVPRLKAEY